MIHEKSVLDYKLSNVKIELEEALKSLTHSVRKVNHIYPFKYNHYKYKYIHLNSSIIKIQAYID